MTLFPLNGLTINRLKFVPLLTYRALSLALGDAGQHVIPLEGTVADVPAHRCQRTELDVLGVLAEYKIVEQVHGGGVAIALTIGSLRPTILIVNRGVKTQFAIVKVEQITVVDAQRRVGCALLKIQVETIFNQNASQALQLASGAVIKLETHPCLAIGHTSHRQQVGDCLHGDVLFAGTIIPTDVIKGTVNGVNEYRLSSQVRNVTQIHGYSTGRLIREGLGVND